MERRGSGYSEKSVLSPTKTSPSSVVFKCSATKPLPHPTSDARFS